ncbi:MAG: protein kinase [Planctomycetes bacterium]|nr:protein kinase [Planctomycetota bacterium]
MRFSHFVFDPKTDMLGEGPLSEVYRAVDERLGRTVALKILRANVDIDPEADTRFAREARHTSQLEHPNIARIYEYGSDGGRSFIVMEYLQGRTLDKIIKERSLGVDEGLRIAVQLTSALALVHRSGLIHRDLKPANVMVLHDGTVKLLDFGIARANNESGITQHGMLVGTVLYMSPEQVRGDELNARSDVFSLGAVLYHALSGQLPFPGNSFPEVCMTILEGRPKPLSQLRSGLPTTFEEFVMKCMSSEPGERYADAEVAHGVIMAISDSLVSGTGVSNSSYLSGRIAIAPIAVTDGGETAAALATGTRRDLATELQRAGMTVQLLPGNGTREVETDFYLHGAFKLDGAKGTLELALDQCKNSRCDETREVWRERIEHTGEEWDLQAMLVRSAVRALRRKLAENALKLEEPATRDPKAARELSLKAHGLLHRGMTRHLLASITLFRRAIEADTQSALGYAGLAEALARKFLYWDGDESFLNEAREHARRALALDPSCAEAHTSLGFAYHLRGSTVDAQREYRLAIQLSQSEWLAHRLLGALLAREGNHKAASPLLQRAIAIKPTYISTYDHLHNVLNHLDRYQEAIEVADSGIGAARKRLHGVPDDQDARVHLAMLLARMGLRDEAMAELERAREIAPKDGFTAFHCAAVHALLGNAVDALDALKAAQARGFYVRAEARNAEFDVLRGLQEFQELVA